MKTLCTIAHASIRAIGLALFALSMLGAAQSSRAEERKSQPPAVVEVAKATTTRP